MHEGDDCVCARARSRMTATAWARQNMTWTAETFAGQVYVALSRVRSLAGLWIRGSSITQAVVKAHPAPLRLYAKVEGERQGPSHR